MSKFVLEKAVEKTRFVLEKKQVKNIKAHVVIDLDVSGSTQDMYHRGLFQKAFQQVLPIGILFDDNQEVDTFTFNNGNAYDHVTPNATKDNYSEYINKYILKNNSIQKWGGTDYAPVLHANLNEFKFIRESATTKKKFFGLFNSTKSEIKLHSTSESGYPVIVFFFTDGENSDKSETLELIKTCQENNVNIYFQFIGISPGNFSFLEALADKFKNTGFVNIGDLEKAVDDDNFTDILLNEELCNYLKNKNE
jgi:hypothetical protein